MKDFVGEEGKVPKTTGETGEKVEEGGSELIGKSGMSGGPSSSGGTGEVFLSADNMRKRMRDRSDQYKNQGEDLKERRRNQFDEDHRKDLSEKLRK
eukprot:913998-Karenia_brevis.AAC.1